MKRIDVAEDAVKAQEELGRIGLAIGNAAGAAVFGRNTTYAGRTFGEFKRALHVLGVKDDDDLGSVEFGVAALTGTRHVHVERDELGAVEVREVRS